MRQAGRYLPEYREVRKRAGSFLELCYTPELAAEVSLQPIRRFDMDGIIMFSDILVVPDALGVPVGFTEGEGPRLKPIAGASAVPRYDPERCRRKLAPVFETLGRIREAAPKSATLLGFAGAPWTVATYMVEGGTSRDFLKAKTWAFSDPDGFQTLIDVLVAATADYLIDQIDAGAEAVQLFDSWAGVLTETEFTRWSILPVGAIVKRVKARHPGAPIIGFPRGAGIGYSTFAEQTGVDAVSLDTAVPLAWAAKTVQKTAAVQGNLDPALLVAGGEPLVAEADSILRAFSGGSHVFNLGHGVVPETPPENVAQLSNFIRAWRK